MLRLLIDNDFNQIILRGLSRRVSGLDVVTAYEIGLSEASDPDLLAWAAVQKRIVVTHDRRTMPNHATDRMLRGEKVAGIIVVPRRLPVSRVIDDLEIVVSCSVEDEWENVVKYLPL